jgi:hypothetical protein
MRQAKCRESEGRLQNVKLIEHCTSVKHRIAQFCVNYGRRLWKVLIKFSLLIFVCFEIVNFNSVRYSTCKCVFRVLVQVT